jgi:hypothetical protein
VVQQLFLLLLPYKRVEEILALNISSDIQEERNKKSLSTTFKCTLFLYLLASMEEEDFLTNYVILQYYQRIYLAYNGDLGI